MGVNSHQMDIVWCLTRKGMKNSEDRIDDEKMGDRILTKWAIDVDEMGYRIDDEMGDRQRICWLIDRLHS